MNSLHVKLSALWSKRSWLSNAHRSLWLDSHLLNCLQVNFRLFPPACVEETLLISPDVWEHLVWSTPQNMRVTSTSPTCCRNLLHIRGCSSTMSPLDGANYHLMEWQSNEMQLQCGSHRWIISWTPSHLMYHHVRSAVFCLHIYVKGLQLQGVTCHSDCFGLFTVQKIISTLPLQIWLFSVWELTLTLSGSSAFGSVFYWIHRIINNHLVSNSHVWFIHLVKKILSQCFGS